MPRSVHAESRSAGKWWLDAPNQVKILRDAVMQESIGELHNTAVDAAYNANRAVRNSLSTLL
jgi:hypothetical protein